MTFSRVSRWAAGPLISVALLSGCTATPTPTPSATSLRPPLSASADSHTLFDAAGVALEFPVVDLAAAEPLTLPEVARITPPPPGADRTILLALGGDKALVAISPAENYGNAEFVKSTRSGLLSDDGTVDLFQDTSNIRSDGLPRQTYAGDVDEQWAVWMETSSTNMYESNWRLFAREIDGGQPVLIAAAEEQRAAATAMLPLLEGDPFPRLSNGLVWWWTAHEQPDGTFRTRILAADPAGGDPLEMLPLGGRLSPVTDGIVAVQNSVVGDPDAINPLQPTGLVLIDTTGKVTDLVRFTPDLEDGSGIGSLASDGDIVAMVMGDAVMILDTSGTPIAQIPVPENLDLWEVAVCAGKVVFAPSTAAGGDKVMIYNTTTRTLAAIDVPKAAPGVYCSDQRIAWTSIDDHWSTYTIATW